MEEKYFRFNTYDENDDYERVWAYASKDGDLIVDDEYNVSLKTIKKVNQDEAAALLKEYLRDGGFSTYKANEAVSQAFASGSATALFTPTIQGLDSYWKTLIQTTDNPLAEWPEVDDDLDEDTIPMKESKFEEILGLEQLSQETSWDQINK